MKKSAFVLLAAAAGLTATAIPAEAASALHTRTAACIAPVGADYSAPANSNATAYALTDQQGRLLVSAGVSSTDSEGFPITASTSHLAIKAQTQKNGAAVVVTVGAGIKDLYRYFQISKPGAGGIFGPGQLNTAANGVRTVTFRIPAGYHLDTLIVSGFDPAAPAVSDKAALQVTTSVTVNPVADVNQTIGSWNNYSEVSTDPDGHIDTYAAQIKPVAGGGTTDVSTQRIVVKVSQPAGSCGSQPATVQIWLGQGVKTVLNGYRISKPDGSGIFGRGAVVKTSQGLTRFTYRIPAGYHLERIDAYGNDSKQQQIGS